MLFATTDKRRYYWIWLWNSFIKLKQFAKSVTEVSMIQNKRLLRWRILRSDSDMSNIRYRDKKCNFSPVRFSSYVLEENRRIYSWFFEDWNWPGKATDNTGLGEISVLIKWPNKTNIVPTLKGVMGSRKWSRPALGRFEKYCLKWIRL